MRFRVLPLCVASVLLVSACSSSSDTSTVTGPPVAPETPATPGVDPSKVTATFRFSTEEGGARAEVTSIVYTQRVGTRVEGLPPRYDVTLSASVYTPGAKGRGWTSTATFRSDDAGVVDTTTMAPSKGTYDGVDPDGLFWSMEEGPLAEGLGDRTAAFFRASIDGVDVGRAALGRRAMAEDVEVEVVTENGLVAELFVPRGAKDRVPVLAFGGSEGGISGGESYAMQLASWGHPTLAVAYFGMKGVPADLTEVPLEYFGKALAYLDGRPEMRKGKAVVIGGSRGGELALQLGATFPGVVGVIAETPSSHRWAGLSLQTKAAWTFEGAPLPYVPSVSRTYPPTVSMPDGTPAWVLRSDFEKNLAAAKPADLDAARIAVEKTNGPVLMLAGADDQMWPACDFSARALAKLTETGHAATYADEAVCYPDAGHSVGTTGLPMTMSMWASIGEDAYALGGTAKGNARAGRATEEKIRAFLARVTK